MDRKKFIQSCSLACMGGIGVATLLQSCSSSRMINGRIDEDDLVVPVSEFKDGKEGSFKKYLVVQQEILQYPICIYRLSEYEYSALWMQCTHQGSELQVFGDKLQCPAHGSEFTKTGNVDNGPAAAKLRSFPVRVENDQLKISLKAI